MKKIFFTPGPSQLFFSVPDHLKEGINNDIFSISHRSKKFKKIYESCITKLRTFLEIPENYNICFLSSANEIWERIIHNLVLESSTHLVNGAFSKKFYDFAKMNKIDAKEFFYDRVEYNEDDLVDDELVALTLNETSRGIMCDSDKISSIRNKLENSLVALDCVSGLPSIPFNISDVDTFYFSVQKCFGLPSGLGVWVYNEKCLEKNKSISDKKITGTYHSLKTLHNKTLNFQTPETPNVLAIFLLSRVLDDMIKIGKDRIIRETNYKSSLLYNTIKQSNLLKEYIENKSIQSKTVIVADTEKDSDYFIENLRRKNLIIGKGYGSTNNQIRIANFPSHSKESIELLCDELTKLQ